MAPTDPNDPRPSRWNLREWLNGVTGGFFGGNKSIIPTGRNSQQAGPAGESTALKMVARKKSLERIPSGKGFRTRREEAKLKNQMWANDIEAMLLERLRQAFHEENFNRMKLSPSLWTNQLRRVVGDLSILYENPARRSLEEKEKKQTQTIGSEPGVIPSKDKKPKAPPFKEKADEQKDPEEDAPPTDEEDTTAADGKPEDKKMGDGEAPVEEEGDGESPALETGDPDIDALADLLDLEGANNPATETPLDKALKLCDLDTTMALVECMTRFHDCVWVRPMVRYERKAIVDDPEQGAQEKGETDSGKLSYIIYDPSVADVVENPENPAEALAFFYWAQEYSDDGKVNIRIHFWTKDTYEKLDEEWKMLGPAKPNPYKRLPVTKFTSELPSPQSYFCNGMGRDLFEQTLELNLLRTIQNARFRDSAFKQLAIMGADQDSIPADQVMGGPSPVMLPEGGSANVLDMQPNLEPMTLMVEQRQLEMAAAKGISGADYKKDGQAQSGFAKKLDRDKILKENRRIRKFFAEGEKDLYNLLALTLAEHPIDGVPSLKPDAEFCIDFGEPSFDEDPKTQTEIDSKQIELNQTNIINILKRDNPDLNEKELVELAYKNKRINEAFIPPESKSLIETLAMAGAQPQMGGGRPGGGASGGKPGAPPPKPGDKPVPPPMPGKKPAFPGAK